MGKRLAITGAADVVVGVVGYVVDVWRKVQIRMGGRYPVPFEDALSGAAGGVATCSPVLVGGLGGGTSGVFWLVSDSWMVGC